MPPPGRSGPLALQSLWRRFLSDIGHPVRLAQAEAELFITLTKQARPMVEAAAKAGYFDSPFGGKRHPRLQLMTIDSLLKGAKPDTSEQDQGSLLTLPGLDTLAVAAVKKGGRRGAAVSV